MTRIIRGTKNQKGWRLTLFPGETAIQFTLLTTIPSHHQDMGLKLYYKSAIPIPANYKDPSHLRDKDFRLINLAPDIHRHYPWLRSRSHPM